MVVAAETGLHHLREVTALLACLVDRDAQRSQARQIHQKVVDKITETSVVVPPDDGTESHAVFAAQRMVAHEGIQPAVVLGRKILLPNKFDGSVKILQRRVKPVNTDEVTALPQESVHLVLMYDTFEPRHHKPRHKSGLFAHLVSQNIINVNRFLSNFYHLSLQNNLQS